MNESNQLGLSIPIVGVVGLTPISDEEASVMNGADCGCGGCAGASGCNSCSVGDFAAITCQQCNLPTSQFA